MLPHTSSLMVDRYVDGGIEIRTCGITDVFGEAGSARGAQRPLLGDESLS